MDVRLPPDVAHTVLRDVLQFVPSSGMWHSTWYGKCCNAVFGSLGVPDRSSVLYTGVLFKGVPSCRPSYLFQGRDVDAVTVHTVDTCITCAADNCMGHGAVLCASCARSLVAHCRGCPCMWPMGNGPFVAVLPVYGYSSMVRVFYLTALVVVHVMECTLHLVGGLLQFRGLCGIYMDVPDGDSLFGVVYFFLGFVLFVLHPQYGVTQAHRLLLLSRRGRSMWHFLCRTGLQLRSIFV